MSSFCLAKYQVNTVFVDLKSFVEEPFRAAFALTLSRTLAPVLIYALAANSFFTAWTPDSRHASDL
jgi:hypothetical protein